MAIVMKFAVMLLGASVVLGSTTSSAQESPSPPLAARIQAPDPPVQMRHHSRQQMVGGMIELIVGPQLMASGIFFLAHKPSYPFPGAFFLTSGTIFTGLGVFWTVNGWRMEPVPASPVSFSVMPGGGSLRWVF